MVARLELVHVRSNLFDNARRFVAQNGRSGELVKTVDKVQVTVTHTTGHDAHDHLVLQRFIDIDVFHGQRLVRAMKDGRFHVSTSCMTATVHRGDVYR